MSEHEIFLLSCSFCLLQKLKPEWLSVAKFCDFIDNRTIYSLDVKCLWFFGSFYHQKCLFVRSRNTSFTCKFQSIFMQHFYLVIIKKVIFVLFRMISLKVFLCKKRVFDHRKPKYQILLRHNIWQKKIVFCPIVLLIFNIIYKIVLWPFKFGPLNVFSRQILSRHSHSLVTHVII